MLHECVAPEPDRRPDMESLHADLLALRAAAPPETDDGKPVAPPVRVLKPATEGGAAVDAVVAAPRRRTRPLIVAMGAVVAAAVVGVASFVLVRELLQQSPAPSSAPTVSTTVSQPRAPSTTVTAPSTTARVEAAPTTTAPVEVAPATTSRVEVGPTTSGVDGVGTAAGPSDFVRSYYDTLNAEDYARGWDLLSIEFRGERAQTFDGYVRYWERYDVSIDDVDVVSMDGDGMARVRIAMQYLTGDQRIAEVDELVVRARDAGWEIVAQTVVG
jgi:hypothetical protein